VNKGELAVVYCFVFFYIFSARSGSWSIDAMIGAVGRRRPRNCKIDIFISMKRGILALGLIFAAQSLLAAGLGEGADSAIRHVMVNGLRSNRAIAQSRRSLFIRSARIKRRS